MKLHYYPETDSLYVEFKKTPGAETREITSGLNVDLDADGQVVGFDIDHASKRVELLTLETESLPLRATRAARPRSVARLPSPLTETRCPSTAKRSPIGPPSKLIP